MLSKVNSVSFIGLDIHKIIVEVTVNRRGLPSFDIVGLPGKSIDESKYRVKAAILNSGFDFPDAKIIVNLAPSYIRKEGTHYDLPIALGILANSLGFTLPADSLFAGELSLNGDVSNIRGVFVISLFCSDMGINSLFVPEGCRRDIYLNSTAKCYPVTNLKELVNHLKHKNAIKEASIDATDSVDSNVIGTSITDFSEIISQFSAKRVLEISAAGAHNVIMTGPPGSGKSMLAKAYLSVLPVLTDSESLEVRKIYSVAANFSEINFYNRPFRSPHHTISYIGMVGGGSPPKPGEITMSHNGVLFLDEFSEFSRAVIESLRQPLEEGYIHITRSSGTARFPADFTLIAACNPCPCGYFGSSKVACKCTPNQIQRYKAKISGPILDRIDLHSNVSSVDPRDLLYKDISAEKSASVLKRVTEARNFQNSRYPCRNARLTKDLIDRFCQIDSTTKKLLASYMRKKSLSARSYYKVLKISRTIADLDLCSEIMPDHVMEALQYRQDT